MIQLPNKLNISILRDSQENQKIEQKTVGENKPIISLTVFIIFSISDYVILP